MRNLLAVIAEKKPTTGMAHTYVRHKSARATCAQDEERHLQRKAADSGNQPVRVPAIFQDIVHSPGQPGILPLASSSGRPLARISMPYMFMLISKAAESDGLELQ